jgi:ankyrin repeat protein
MRDANKQFNKATARSPKKWGQIPKRVHDIPKDDGHKFLKAAKDGDLAEATRLFGRYGKEILEVKERDWGVYNRTDNVTGESHSFTPLMLAVNGGHRPVIEWLLDQGADVNARFDHGQTVLMLGLDENDNLAQLLLDRGADITARNDGGDTCLMWPQTAESLRYLISRGAEVDAPDNDGRTPLMNIAGGCYLHNRGYDPSAGLAALLEGGAYIDARDNKGKTALMVAAEHSVYDEDTPGRLRFLIGHGANPLLRDNDGNTAAMHALRPRPDLDGDKPRQKEMGALLEKAAQEWNEKQVEVCVTGSPYSISVGRPLKYRKPAA